MKRLSEYREQCLSQDRAGFVDRHPMSFLVHSSRKRELQATGNSFRPQSTVDQFVLEGKTGPRPKLSAEEDWYTAIEVMPRSGNGVTVTIGSDRKCDVRIDDVSLSRLHAEITVKGAALEIQDRSSIGGTAVNGRALSADERCSVRSGDRITLGYVELLLYGPAEFQVFVRETLTP